MSSLQRVEVKVKPELEKKATDVIPLVCKTYKKVGVYSVAVNADKVIIVRSIIDENNKGDTEDVFDLLNKKGFKPSETQAYDGTPKGKEKEVKKDEKNDNKKDDKNEKKKDATPAKDDIQAVVLKLDCEGNLSDEKKLLAMKEFAKSCRVEYISIDDSSKVMTIRGKADAVVSGLLGLKGIEDLSFTVHTLSLAPKPKPEEKKKEDGAKDDGEKKNEKKNEDKFTQKEIVRNKTWSKEGVLTEVMSTVTRSTKIRGVHSICLENMDKLLVVVKSEHEPLLTKRLKREVKKWDTKFSISATKEFKTKPATKVEGKDEKKKIVLKLDAVTREVISEAMARVSKAKGLDSISIESPAKPEKLTLTGNLDIKEVLELLFAEDGKSLKGCTTFVSVGPNKKEEEKKNDGGGKKDPAPGPAPAQPYYVGMNKFNIASYPYNYGRPLPPGYPYPYEYDLAEPKSSYSGGCSIM